MFLPMRTFAIRYQKIIQICKALRFDGSFLTPIT